MIEAARRWDPSQEVRFETFCEHRIRGAMLDELRRMDHLPRRLRADLDRLQREREVLQRELGREPEVEELAGRLGIESGELAELEALLVAPQEIDTALGLAAEAPAADESLARAESAALLAAGIGALPERLQLVLSLYYVEGLTYREIAKILGVSEPRICQLHGEAVKKIRASMEAA